jgi:hypothetical protein
MANIFDMNIRDIFPVFDKRAVVSQTGTDVSELPAVVFPNSDSLIITGVTCEESPNYSLRVDLSGIQRYLSFNEKPVSLVIQGLIPPPSDCGGEGLGNSGTVNALYASHKVGKTPMVVKYGGASYSVFIAKKSIKTAANNGNSSRVETFSLLCVGKKNS